MTIGMTSSTAERDKLKCIAGSAGVAIRPERLDEVAQLTQGNIETLRQVFRPLPLDVIPSEFLLRLGHRDG